MKSFLPIHITRPRNGFALVVVLAFMAVLIAIVVGFLTRATTERRASTGFGSAINSRQLADTAITLVEAQINLATNQGNTVAWASQPGMVRTFDTTGNLLQAYKLYSADNMVSSTVNLTTDIPPATWSTDVSLWTDLNSPVTVGASKNYPILDPSGAGTIAGFSIAVTAPTTATQTAPMPVKWLYQLQDGSLVYPTGTGKSATVVGETAANPIVGRIGFWTDDETCKVNINTAAGDEDASIISPSTAPGSFWDTPRYASLPERQNYSDRIPARNEFQRFPGHPATVYLSKIFPSLTRTQISAIAPRITEGGTKGGTVDTKTSAVPITSDTDRIYTSVDELIFDPSRLLNTGLSSKQVEQAKFFLTAQSRAPEVNLFNLPRISMWPLDNRGDAYLTAFDKVLRQCATINGSGYYFKRSDSQSQTTDAGLNTTLYNYLDVLTKKTIPSFGGNFDAKYPLTRTQLLVEMLDYIRSTNLHDTYLTDATKRYTSTTQKGQVVPLLMNSKMGFGRFFTLSEAGLVFANEAESSGNPAVLYTKSFAGAPTGPLLVNEKIIQPAWLMEPFCVAAGYTTVNAETTWAVSGLDSFRVTDATGVPVQIFPSGVLTQTISRLVGNPGSNKDLGDGLGGLGDFRNFINFISNGNYGAYKFLGNQVKVTGDEFAFSGGTVTITIYSGTGVVSANKIQTITLNFPSSTSGKFPSPRFEANLDLLSNRTQQLFTSGGTFNTAEVNTPTIVSGNPPTTIVNPALHQWISAWDTTRTMIVKSGDIRDVANRSTINNATDAIFAKVGNFDKGFTTVGGLNNQKAYRLAHAFEYGNHDAFYGYNFSEYYNTGGRGSYPLAKYPAISTGTTSSSLPPISGTATSTGDFDNGVALLNDGAYINKPDEGVLSNNGNFINYFSLYNGSNSLDSGYFSPNRIIPSPGMFGSLLTDGAFRTLLFRNQSSHPNSRAPKDYLLMDLFWMPIVQPYSISEPFSTAGKINLNHQIFPFTYINRTTALEAALAGEKYLAIPILASGGANNGVIGYKSYGNSTNSSTIDYRKPINATYFLSQIKPIFDAGDVFKSASQICDYDLDSFNWITNSLTGDNTRERPYTNIYQKLTTKSNTYTVHYRVQSLKKLKTSTPATWTENKDVVLAEYRGSTTIERFIDANNTSIPDYLSDPTNAQTLDTFYRWRIVSNRQFAP